MATTKRRRSKTFKLMESKSLSDEIVGDKLTYIETDPSELDMKSPSLSVADSDSSAAGSDGEDEEGYVRFDLHKPSDLEELDKTFATIEGALSAQKAKLAAKWDLLGASRSSSKSKTRTVSSDALGTKTTTTTTTTSVERSLLIDLKHVLARIGRIGMIRGKRFEELESEQNRAIEKLSSVVDLEEEARTSRNKAIEIQQETELEMKQIDGQRAIIAKELKKAEPDLLAARLAVEDISDRALNELLSLKNPPSTVTNVLTVAVWIVNSVRQDKPTIVALKESASVATGSAGGGRARGGHRDLTRGSSVRARPRGRDRTSTAGSPTLPDKAARRKARKAPKTPRGTKSKKGLKAKRKRAQSTLDDMSPLASSRARAKTPGAGKQFGQFGQFGKHSTSVTGLTPLSESKSEVKKRAKSKNIGRSRSNSKFGSKNGGKNGTPRHKASNSRIDKLKSRNFEKILTQPWHDTRVMLTRGNFKKRVLAFDPKTLDRKVCARIEDEFLKLEDFEVHRADRASKVLGPLVKWIRSLVGYTQIWYRIEPMANKVAELALALDVKKLEVKRLKNISEVSHSKVINIRSEMLKMVGYHKIGHLYFLS